MFLHVGFLPSVTVTFILMFDKKKKQQQLKVHHITRSSSVDGVHSVVMEMDLLTRMFGFHAWQFKQNMQNQPIKTAYWFYYKVVCEYQT